MIPDRLQVEESGIQRHRATDEDAPLPAPSKKNHADLLDWRHLLAIANLEGPSLEAYASLFVEAEEFEDADLMEWVMAQLKISLSKHGFRSEQIVQSIRAGNIHVATLEAAMRHQEAPKKEEPAARGAFGR